MNENSKTPLQPINANLCDLDDATLRIDEDFVSNVNQMEKVEKEIECHKKRKSSDVEVDGSEQHTSFFNDNENLPVEEPKSKKARRGRPASAKKCSTTLKQRTRAKNKRWSDSDSQQSDHDMYKGTINSLPMRKRETTQRKAASKVKYTFDTDEEESEERNLSYILSQEKFNKKEQGNSNIIKVKEAERETSGTTKVLKENGQLTPKAEHSSTEANFHTLMIQNENTTSCNEFKDDNEPMESTKNESSGDGPHDSGVPEISGEVSKMVKNLSLSSSSIISDSSSDSSFSLFIDLKTPTAEVTDNPRTQESDDATNQRQENKMEKPADPRIRRRLLLLKSKIEKLPTGASLNDNIETKAHVRDASAENANSVIDNTSPGFFSPKWIVASPGLSSPSDDSSTSSCG